MNSTSLYRVSETWENFQTCPVNIAFLFDALREDKSNLGPIVTVPVYFLLVLKISSTIIQSIHPTCQHQPLSCFVPANEEWVGFFEIKFNST